MAVDIFVHPQYPEDDIFPTGKNVKYTPYFDDLTGLLDGSDFPILIKGPNDAQFMQVIPKSQQFESVSVPGAFGFEYHGEISDSEWKRFSQVLAQVGESDYVIHGSYFGRCVEDFAIQLAVFLIRNEHWMRVSGSPDKEGTLKMHERNGDFARSKIRYGIVFSDQERDFDNIFADVRIIPPSENGLIRRLSPVRRNGNITYQLTSPDTRIYRLR